MAHKQTKLNEKDRECIWEVCVHVVMPISFPLNKSKQNKTPIWSNVQFTYVQLTGCTYMLSFNLHCSLLLQPTLEYMFGLTCHLCDDQRKWENVQRKKEEKKSFLQRNLIKGSFLLQIKLTSHVYYKIRIHFL